MKQFTIICCFLSLFIPSIETAIACDDDPNCDGVQFDEAEFKTNESVKKQREILAVLFKISKDDVDGKIKYWYNYYGANCCWIEEGKHVYKGGHSGWDVRTLYEIEEDPLSINQPFYSLTNGIVILNGTSDEDLPNEDDTNGEIKYNTIAIYDADAQKTTFYLHASKVNSSLKKGQMVKVGHPLGNQGDKGSPGAFHVHLEVQEGEVEEGDFIRASAGTKDAGTQTIDPISYLHESIQEQQEENREPRKPNIIKQEPEAQRITLERGERERFEIEAHATDGVAIAYIEFSAEGQDSEKDSCRRNCMEHDASVRYRWDTPREEPYKVTAEVVDVNSATTETSWFVEVPHAPIEITDLSPASNGFDDVQRIEVDVNEAQEFFIEARSGDDIQSISFVVSNYEQTRRTQNCRRFCRSESYSIRYRFLARGQYNVVATIESKTGKIVAREWIVTVQWNPAAPSLAKPHVTTLLANYPNPFNPETWIPYQLGNASDVQINIYNSQGVLVRVLPLGHQPAGYYTRRSRAAYWDGKNTLGEPVASGVYFYQLESDKTSLMRKMVILK